MKSRLLLIAGLVVSMAVGGLLGEWQDRRSTWQADRELLADLGIRPEPLGTESKESFPESAQNDLQFVGVTPSGTSFVYDNGPEGRFHLAETLGGGVGAIDFDRDGSSDIVLIDGGDPINWPTNRTSRVTVLRCRAPDQFRPVTAHTRIDWTGYGHGCAVADVNNDGFDDILLTGYQQSRLYMNAGDGTFEEAEDLRDLVGDKWCASAAWSDLDLDGDLDVYIACYADSPRTLPTPFCEVKGVRIHCNPHSYGPVSDLLLENLGDGSFADRSETSGIAEYREYGLGVLTPDLDGDGVPEIFVANDGDRNLLFRQTAPWTYEEIALASGVAFNGQGESMGSMGAACADFDRNGQFDLFTTNFSRESNALFRQVGNLVFTDDSQGTLVDRSSRALVGWAAIAFDANCDRFLDLFVANGHVTEMPGEEVRQRAILLRGSEQGLTEVSRAGPWFEYSWNARGASRVDLDRDGLDDLVVSLIDSPAIVLLNRSVSPGHRVQLRLVGTMASRSVEDALIEVTSASGHQIHLSSRAGGYLSTHGDVLTIGLGVDTKIESLRIRWPRGDWQELRDIPADRLITVIEGRDTILESDFEPQR